MMKNVESTCIGTRQAAVHLLLLGALAIAGCATSPDLIAFERRSYAESLGLGAYMVSVALSVDDVLRTSEGGSTFGHLDQDPEWGQFSSRLRGEDELRLVSCGNYGPYFFASIRDGRVADRYLIMVLD